MKKIVILLLLITVVCEAQNFKTQDIHINELIDGTLYTPEKITKKTKLVIIIAGSGSTNRNGNQPEAFLFTNSYKYLGQELAKNNIAVFSYDKRSIKLLKEKKVSEKDLRFEDMITDAVSVLEYFRKENKFKKILFAGHSEGSLIGMVASKKGINGFVSIACPGESIDKTMLMQIEKNMPNLLEKSQKYFDTLRMGKTFSMKDEKYKLLFRESVQPYMISWMKYDPTKEIQNLECPILIINGDKDIQVAMSNAEKLHEANPKSTLKIIPNMNHILKNIDGNEAENRASYSKGDLPLSDVFLKEMISFINRL